MSAALQHWVARETTCAIDYSDAHTPLTSALQADGGGYSSHLPMALHALADLGADDARLRAWAEAAWPGVPAAAPWPTLDAAQARWAAQLQDPQGLARGLASLMPGCGAMAFHALIRTAHALEAGHRPSLARALAYWQLRSAPLPGPMESAAPRLALPDWLDALLALPLPLDFSQAWINTRMASAGAEPAFQDLAPRLALHASLLPELARWLAGAYADSGNFTLLHGVTATRAMTVLLPLLDPAARPQALRAFTRQLAAALLASRWRGERRPLDLPPRDWPALRVAAIAHNDDHAIKLAHAAWQLGAQEADPVWRRAAERALISFG